ncbi:hypothetical protein Lesp01_84980 [Lentzea sp. NBRC 102530]|nr:hypothetical protein Lesp01_84980 [Lentzea sp. NBRC 102530]
MSVNQRTRSHAVSSNPQDEDELHAGFWTGMFKLFCTFRIQAPVVQSCVTVLAVQWAGTMFCAGAHLPRSGYSFFTSDCGRRKEAGDSPSAEWVHIELHEVRSKASFGDAESARRTAELYELLDQDDVAAKWWHEAARLGDPDAIDYVNHILSW